MEKRGGAANHFWASSDAMADYFAVHQHMKDAPRKVRTRLRTLDQSMVVLITAWWEAYCEQRVIESAGILFAHAPSPALLPKDLQRSLALSLKRDKNELSPWSLAGEAWRAEGIKHAESLVDGFSTPNSVNTARLFRDAIGLKDVIDAWNQGAGPLSSRWTLDEWTEVRHRIAHTSGPIPNLPKTRVKEYIALIRGLVRVTEDAVDSHLLKYTHQPDA